MMRLSLPAYLNDFRSFLLFLRLAAVVFVCVIGVMLIAKSYGPGFGVCACLVAYPLWWYHFGLPRFKEQVTGIFSAEFCMWGYIIMTVWLLVFTLEYLDVLKEAAGNFPESHQSFFSKKHMIRFLIIFAVLCVYGFFKSRLSKGDRNK